MTQNEEPTTQTTNDAKEDASAQSQSKSSRLWKWTKRLILFLLLLVVGIGVFSQTQAFRDMLRNQIQARVNAQFKGHISIGKIEGNLLTDLTIRDVKLFDGRKNLALKLDQVSTNYSPWSLVNMKFTLEVGEIRNATAIVRFYPDGALNFTTITEPSPKKTDSAPTAFVLNLDDVQLKGGQIIYVDERPMPKESAEDIKKAHPALQKVTALLKEDINTLPSPKLPETIKPMFLGTSDALAPRVAGLFDLNVALGGKIDFTGPIDLNIKSLTTHIGLEKLKDTLPFESRLLKVDYNTPTLKVSSNRLALTPQTYYEGLSLELKLSQDQAAPVEQFDAKIAAIHVGDKLINAIAPKPVLKQPLRMSLNVKGKPEDILLQFIAKAGAHGEMKLDGRIEQIFGYLTQKENKPKPKYTAKMQINGLKLNQILHDVPDIQTQATLELNGEGLDPKTMRAGLVADVGKTQYTPYKMDSARLDVALQSGKVEIKQGDINTPYLDAKLTGFATMPGAFDLKLTAARNTRHANDIDLKDQKISNTKADVNITASGKLNLEHPDPVGKIQHAKIKGGWSFVDFKAEDISVGSSKAKLDIEFTSPTENNKVLAYDIAIEGTSISSPKLKATWIDLKTVGKLTIPVPMDNPMSIGRRLFMDTRLKGQGIRGFGVTLNRINTTLQLRPTTNLDGLDYKLDGDLRGFNFRQRGSAPIQLGQANFNLRGWLALNFNAKPANVLRQMRVAGKVKTIDFKIKDTAHVQGALITMDLKGKPPEMEGTLHVQAAKITANKERFTTADLTVKLKPGMNFDVKALANRRTGRPNKIDATIQGRLASDFKKINIKKLTLALPNKRNWTIEDTSVNLRGGQVGFDKLVLQQGNQRLEVDGAYKNRGTQNLTVKAKNIQIGELLADAGMDAVLPSVKGELKTLDFSIEGTAKTPVIFLEIILDDFYYDGQGPFSLKIKGRYAQKKLTVTTLDFDGFKRNLIDGQLRVPIDINLHTMAFKLDWDAPLLASMQISRLVLDEMRPSLPVLQQYQATGSIEGLATISGTLNKPTLDSLIKADKLGIKGSFGGQTVSVKNLNIESRIDYSPPVGTKGGLVLKGWVDWLNSKEETEKGVKRAKWALSTPLPVAVWLSDLINKGTKPTLTKNLLTKPFNLAFNVNQFNLKKLDVDPLMEQSDASGILSMALTGKGTFLTPTIDFKVNIGKLNLENGQKMAEGGFGWNQFRDIVIDADLGVDRNAIKLNNLSVNWDQTDILKANASFPIKLKDIYEGNTPKDLPLTMRLNILPVPMRKFQAASYQLASIPGVLKGGLEISGKLSAPKVKGGIFLNDTQVGQSNGDIELNIEAYQDVVSVEALVLSNDQRLLSAVSRARLNINGVELVEGKDPLVISSVRRGYTPGQANDKLVPKNDLVVAIQTYQGKALPLKSILPAFFIKKFARRYDGTLKADVQVSGQWDNLRSDGQLTLANGMAYIDTWGRKFTDVHANVQLEKNTIKIDTAVKEGPTSVSLTGDLEHQNFNPKKLNINAETKQFNLGDFVDQRFFASSKVNVKSEFGAKRLRTNVHIKDLDVILPENISSGLHGTSLNDDIEVVTATQQANLRKFHDSLSKELYAMQGSGILDMNVAVKLDNDSAVFHPAYGRMVFGGKIGVEIKQGQTKLSGGIQTVSGQAEFLGRQFSVAKGYITFTESTPPNPRLQIEALNYLDRSLIPSIGQPVDGRVPKIIVRITGTAADPRLKLLSDPQMSDTDILYILATGRPPSNAEVGQDAGVVSAALGAASGLLLGMLQQELKGKIPFQIKLDAGDEGLSDSSIEFGRYVTEDIFVSYKHKLGGSSGVTENIFTVEYHFAPRWLMEAQYRYSDNSQGQFNVFWDAY